MIPNLPEGYGAECAIVPDCTATAVSDGVPGCGQHLPGALGITYRQLAHWSASGWLHPEGSTGTGYKRWWPAAEAEVARRMGVLVAAGISVERAAAIARSADWPRAEIAPGVVVEVVAETWTAGLRTGRECALAETAQ